MRVACISCQRQASHKVTVGTRVAKYTNLNQIPPNEREGTVITVDPITKEVLTIETIGTTGQSDYLCEVHIKAFTKAFGPTILAVERVEKPQHYGVYI